MALLTDGNIINSSAVNEVINLVKSVMGLFGEYPLNILLIATLMFVGFRLFGSASRAVR